MRADRSLPCVSGGARSDQLRRRTRCVDFRGYGPAIINKAVTITAIGVDATVTATSGNALTINTTGNVTITVLGLHGEGTGSNGVFVTHVGFLRLYNATAESFTGRDVFTSAGNLAIYDSHFNDNGIAGLSVSGGEVYV